MKTGNKRSGYSPASLNRRHRAATISLLTVTFFLLTGPAAGAQSAATSNQGAVPAIASHHFSEARAAQARGDWSTAEAEYLKAIEAVPTWAEALVNLGIVYNRQNKTDAALAAFSRAAKLNPNLLGAHLNLGIGYFRLKQFNDAEGPLRRVLEIEPENRQAASLLALTLFALGRNEEVVLLTEKLSNAVREDAVLLEVSGRAYMKLHRYQDAVRILERRATVQPISGEALSLLGEARDNAGDAEGAVAEFRRAIDLMGAAPVAEVHYALGYVLWKLRRFQDAEASFKKELERDPAHGLSIYYLGNISLSRGDWSRALSLLDRAVQLMPARFEARYDFGKALLSSGDAKKAAEEFRAAIQVNPRHSGAHYQLGVAYRKMNRDAEAQREFAIARDLNESEREELVRKVQGEELKKKKPQ